MRTISIASAPEKKFVSDNQENLFVVIVSRYRVPRQRTMKNEVVFIIAISPINEIKCSEASYLVAATSMLSQHIETDLFSV